VQRLPRCLVGGRFRAHVGTGYRIEAAIKNGNLGYGRPLLNPARLRKQLRRRFKQALHGATATPRAYEGRWRAGSLALAPPELAESCCAVL
jgi:hypothetical protein